MLNFMRNFKTVFVSAFFISLVAFALLTLIGGIFFDIDPAFLASLFVVFYVVMFAVAFVIMFFCFLGWFFVESPSFLRITVVVILLALLAVLAFVASDIHFLSSVGDSLMGIFSSIFQ